MNPHFYKGLMAKHASFMDAVKAPVKAYNGAANSTTHKIYKWVGRGLLGAGSAGYVASKASAPEEGQRIPISTQGRPG